MKAPAVFGLVAGAVVLLGAALLLVRPHTNAEPEPGTEPLVFPGLADKVNTVASVSVKSDKEFTIRQASGGGAWEMAEKGNYPVNFEKVKAVVVGMAELRIAEEKTSKPELYAKLGVQDPGTPVKQGEKAPVLLTLKDTAGADLASVIVGNSRYSPKQGVYIRKPGEAKSWAANGQLDVPSEASSWMDTKVLEVPRDRIKSAKVTQADGSVLEVSKPQPSDAGYTVLNVPEGKELKPGDQGGTLAAALAWLGFEDVAPAATLKTQGEGAATSKWSSEFRTFDGLVVVIGAFEQGGKTWVKIVPSFDDTAAAPTENRAPSLRAPEDVLKEVAEIGAKVSPWVFVLPEWKATVLSSKMDGLLKETPPAPPPAMQATDTVTPPGAPAVPAPPPSAPSAPTGKPSPAPTAPAPAPAPSSPPQNPGS